MCAINNSPLAHSVAPAMLNGARSDTSIAISFGVIVYYKEDLPSPESTTRIQRILASRFPTTCESSAVVPIYSLPTPPTLQAISSRQTQASADCVNIMCATDNTPLAHSLAAAMAFKGAHFNTFVAILFGLLLIVIIAAFRRCRRWLHFDTDKDPREPPLWSQYTPAGWYQFGIWWNRSGYLDNIS
jgi:hypothetical protein